LSRICPKIPTLRLTTRIDEPVGQIRDNRDASQEAAMSSDPRWGDDARDNSWEHVQRDRESRERDSNDPRDAFMRHVDLPRGPDREIVHERNREYSLRGSETRTLSTIGAFRVVPTGQLRDHNDGAAHDRSADIRHLREQGLIETVRVPGHRGSVAVLTKQGRDLLERNRVGQTNTPQSFYAGLKRVRELEHDAQIYGAYLQAAERMQERGVRVNRVVLDYELKRDYQKWLHEQDGDRDDYDGHHDRTDEEIRAWAAEHHLPYFDDQVPFLTFGSSTRSLTDAFTAKMPRS
jgi:hypothetical protein